jgi:hypothetical protein
MGSLFVKLAAGSALAASVAALTVADAEAGERRETRWYHSGVTLTYDASMDKLGADAFARTELAARAWRHVPRIPGMSVVRGRALPMGFDRGEDNTNSVHYSAAENNRAGGALAITVVTFDVDTKEILDADVLVNGTHPFCNAGILAGKRGPHSDKECYDLQNVMAHEMGHVLGLGENPDFLESTMFPYSGRGEIGKRDVSPADVDEVGTLYTLNNKDSGCLSQVAGRGGSSNGWWVSGVLVVGALAFARRRRLGAAGTLLVLALVPAFGGDDSAVESAPKTTALLNPSHSTLASTKLMGATQATVSATTGRWEQGSIVTRVEFEIPHCAAEDSVCDRLAQPIEVWGGEVDGLGQIVGTQNPPAVGEQVEVELRRDARGTLSPFVRTRLGRVIRAKD